MICLAGFWEARLLWGQVKAAVRKMALTALTTVQPTEPQVSLLHPTSLLTVIHRPTYYYHYHIISACGALAGPPHRLPARTRARMHGQH